MSNEIKVGDRVEVTHEETKKARIKHGDILRGIVTRVINYGTHKHVEFKSVHRYGSCNITALSKVDDTVKPRWRK